MLYLVVSYDETDHESVVRGVFTTHENAVAAAEQVVESMDEEVDECRSGDGFPIWKTCDSEVWLEEVNLDVVDRIVIE